MKHSTLEELEKYLNGKTGIFKSGHIERHIAKCAECSDKLKGLKEADKLAEEVKISLKTFHDSKSEHDQTFLNISKVFGIPKHGTSV